MSKLFGDIVRKLPNEDIIISSEDDGNISIKTDVIGISGGKLFHRRIS